MTRTIRDNVAAASFAFIASVLVSGAVLVATMSAAPAQTFTLPGVDTSNSAQTTGTRLGQVDYYCCGGMVNGRVTSAQGNNSSNVIGMPSTANSTTSGATTFSGVKK